MITSTLALRPTLAAAAPSAPAPTSSTAVHPEVEWWEVGGQRFDSTADLVKGFQPTVDGTEATYHFRHEMVHTTSDTAWDTAGGALIGGAIGGGVFLAGAAILGAAGEILNGLMFGALGSGSLPLLGIGLVGAALGAWAGGASALESSRQGFEQGTAVSGKILKQLRPDGSTKPMFYPGGALENGVDLEEYGKSTAPAAPPQAPAGSKWLDALKGAAIGAALPATIIVPIAGPFIPTWLGAKALGAADNNPRRGTVIGGTLGALTTVGLIVGANTLGLPAMGAASAIGAVAGAVVGPKAFAGLRQASLNDQPYQGQWWRSHENAS